MPGITIVFDAYGTLYDVQSVAAATEAAFPGHGEAVTQVWRLKQLEYSWLRSMMGRYEDFAAVTRQSLAYTLEALGLRADPATTGTLVDAYDRLSPYPETAEALTALAGHRRAILSNGSPAMLDALVRNSGFSDQFDAVVSVDAARAYKPDPRAYALVEARLGVRPEDILFVSSNGFDVAGAKAFGFTVARIQRAPATPAADSLLSPAAMFRALRGRTESLGYKPDFVLNALTDLPEVIATMKPG